LTPASAGHNVRAMTRTLGAVCIAVFIAPCPALAGQLSMRLHVGAVASTALMRDSILRPVVVEPATALSAAAGVGWQVSPRVTADGELVVARADLSTREGSTERTINTVTSVGLTGGLSVPLFDRATARVGIGGIRYFPADEIGIFARGGAASVMGAASIAYRWTLSPRVELGAELRYDLHTFTTAELEARGFDNAHTVQRVGLGLTVVYKWPP